MRLGLVPECHRRNIVLQRQITATRSPAQSLDGHFEIFVKPDGIHDVPTVKPEALLRLVQAIRTNDLRQAGIGSCEFLVTMGFLIFEIV